MPNPTNSRDAAVSPSDRFDPGPTGVAIDLAMPHGRLIATSLMLATLGLFLLFASTVDYTSKLMVHGAIAPSSGVVVVKTPELIGVADEVRVVPGQIVKRGDVLLVIKNTASGKHGAGEAHEPAKSKAAQLESLLAETDLHRQLTERRSAAAQTEIEEARAQVEGLRTRRATALMRLQIAEEAFMQFQTLSDNGFVTAGPVREKQSDVLAQKQALAELDQQILTQRSRANQAQRAFEIVLAETKITDQAAKRNQLEMREQLDRAEVGQSQVVLASSDAVVGSVSIQAGQSVRPGMDAITLLPTDAKLVGELLYPVNAEAELVVGQKVYLQFESSSKVRSLRFPGKVYQVDAVPKPSSSSDAQVEPKGLRGTVRFLVALDVSTEDVRAAGVPLRSGLPVRAFIPQATHSLLGWVVKMMTKS